MKDSNKFQANFDKWLSDVADQCDKFARITDLDFYVFQSDYPKRPVDLLILGINPGGSGSYTQAIVNKRKERKDQSINKRDRNMLAQGVNIYAVDGVGNDVMRRKLKRVFSNDFLAEELFKSTVANIYYFNTRDVQALGELSPEIKSYCEHKTKELIDILCPKRLIIFCTNLNGGLKQIGVTNVQTLPYCLKKALLNGRDILLMPNPGYYKAYSYQNGQQMGQVIENYLKTGTIEITSQTSLVPSGKTHKKNKLDLDQLLGRLDTKLTGLGLFRYDNKRYQTLPCGLQLTITKEELCIRHIDYNGKQNYVDHEYPLANSIRSILHNNGFITTSAVWLGTKRLKDIGENLDQLANGVATIISNVIDELRMFSS